MSLLWPCLLLLITFRSINVNRRLLKAKVEFLWWVVAWGVWVGGWGGGCKDIFQNDFCVEIVLCCVVGVGVVTITAAPVRAQSSRRKTVQTNNRINITLKLKLS